MVFVRSHHNIICTVNGKWIVSDNDYILVSLLFASNKLLIGYKGLCSFTDLFKICSSKCNISDLLCALLIKLAGGFYVRVLQYLLCSICIA